MLFVGLAITLSHIVTGVIPAAQALGETWTLAVSKGVYPTSIFNTWIGGDLGSLQPVLFFFLLPLLACIPYAGSLSADRTSGYKTNILTRISTGKYYFAKYVAIYLSAAVVIIVPLLANFIATHCFIPAVNPSVSAGTFPLFAKSMWADTFYSAPYQYLFQYFLLIFAFSGLLATTCMFFSFLSDNRFVVLVAPFLISLFLDFAVGNLFSLPGFSPMEFLNPAQPIAARLSVIMIQMAVMFFGVIGFLLFQSKNNEAYK